MAMEKNILIINIGSSSKKYSLHLDSGDIFEAHFEKNANDFLVTYTDSGPKEILDTDFNNSLNIFNEYITSRGYVDSEKIISGIGFRIVAPGTYFTEDRIVDESFLSKLNEVKKNDEVHIVPMLDEIQKIVKIFPNTKILAISDSAFHRNLPEVSKNYSIPKSLAMELDLYRFGYHGISLSSIVKNQDLFSALGSRVIVCHLGSGASITALKSGKSVDTSMGYSPLNGVVMSSRVGDIDVGAVMALNKHKNEEELLDIFYNKSGLLGISELSNDMRVLLNAEEGGDDKASLAVDIFIYNIQKYIGAFAGVLEGVDAIVFSGTIGERSHIIRSKICNKLSWLGVKIDNDKNNTATDGIKISSEGVDVYVVHTNEAAIMADKVNNFLLN
jgi:acetate kinase